LTIITTKQYQNQKTKGGSMLIITRSVKILDKNKIEKLFLTKNIRLKWNFFEFMRKPECFAIVAENNKQIIGFGTLTIDISPLQGKTGRLEDIFIHPNHRKTSCKEQIIKKLIYLGEKINLDQFILKEDYKMAELLGFEPSNGDFIKIRK
jgi:N-acetylglutamate synthase-like GNAT family acetyltransferase